MGRSGQDLVQPWKQSEIHRAGMPASFGLARAGPNPENANESSFSARIRFRREQRDRGGRRRTEARMAIRTCTRSSVVTYAKPIASVAHGAALVDEALFAAPAEHRATGGLYRRRLKRSLDILLSASALLIVSPVVLVFALLVARDGGRPFYTQTRLGRGGQPYRIWKLRSMVPEAEAALEALLARDPAARAEWDRTQKLRDDPRVTRLGRLLRRFSIDELPQFWNVLRGDMSLVGPRPMLPEQAADYPGRAYYALRPGITGPWQVHGRNATAFADRAGFDEDYDRDLSLLTDLRLLAATVAVVLRGTGC
jgi:lipopolysaccharide/colanic/teichoic acid biosynthesis glycosyltransferase